MIPSAVESAEAPESIEKMPNLAINADDQNCSRRCLRASWWKARIITPPVWSAFLCDMDIDSAIEDLNTRYNAAYDKLVDGGAERIVYPKF